MLAIKAVRVVLFCIVGKNNVAPDALKRACYHQISLNLLCKLHVSLRHPGITRLTYFVPYSIVETYHVVNPCKDCCRIKPQF